MTEELAPITDDFLADLYGPCAIGSYHRGEKIAYHDGDEVKEGAILWLHAGRRGVVYIINDGVYDCILVPEEDVISLVYEIKELSPVI